MSLPGLLGCPLPGRLPSSGHRLKRPCPTRGTKTCPQMGASAAQSSLHTGRPRPYLAPTSSPPPPRPKATGPPPPRLQTGTSALMHFSMPHTNTAPDRPLHLLPARPPPQMRQLVFLGRRSQHGSHPLLPTVSCSSMLNSSISPVSLASKIYSESLLPPPEPQPYPPGPAQSPLPWCLPPHSLSPTVAQSVSI